MTIPDLTHDLEKRDATIVLLTHHLKALRGIVGSGYMRPEHQAILRDVDSELAALGEVRAGSVLWMKQVQR